MKGHNKKRNVGIIYELLLRSVSSSLIEGKKDRAQMGLNILRRRFAKNSEIYSEFRIFNALSNAEISNRDLAISILSESKKSAREINNQKLFREKSALIRDINKKLKDNDFFNRKIPNYKDYATIQTVVNSWKMKNKSDLKNQALYEEKILNNLLKEKKEQDVSDLVTPEVDSLVVKIMTEKFNNLYSNKLTLEQKNIIRKYVFSGTEEEKSNFRKFLKEIKEKSIEAVYSLRKTTDNSILNEKIEPVIKKIQNLDSETVSDENVERFLKISDLKNQILSEAKI